MYKIDNATAAAVIPTPGAVGPNVDGYFTGGDPSLGVPATRVDADWLNAVQDEIANVITYVGTTLVKTTRTQLRDAIRSITQNGASIYAASSTAANTYTATLAPVPAAYTTGMFVLIKFTNHNTGSATINLNSLGAKSIKRIDGSALTASDIADGMIAALSYDGTNFQLLNINPANLFSAGNQQNETYSYAASSTAPNTYVASLSVALTAYTTGQRFSIKFTNANTSTTPTLNIDAVGAKTIVRPDGSALYVGNIQAGMIADLRYDGTNLQLLNPYGNVQRDNLIIGGDFSTNPWQRNTSFAAVADGVYTADQWLWRGIGTGVVTIAKTADAPTATQAGVYSSHCLSVTVTTADSSIAATDLYVLQQRVIGRDWLRFAQKTLMVSFWVKSSLTGTYCVHLSNGTVTPDRCFVGEYTINSADTWEYKTVLVVASTSAGTWDYTNLIGMTIGWSLSAGSNFQTTAGAWNTGNFLSTSSQVNFMATNSNVFKVQLAKVEPGAVATPYVARPVTLETKLCRQFYNKTYTEGVYAGASSELGSFGQCGIRTSASGVTFRWQFAAEMRAAPTVTVYSTTGASGKIRDLDGSADINATSSRIGTTSAQLLNSGTLTSTNFNACQAIADASL